jgi:orotidine-5'-phosphate decarboxylase
MTVTIAAALTSSWANTQSLLCVGLDPEPARFPAGYAGRPDCTFEFCREIVDATSDLTCAYKPQIAYFAATGQERALERVIEYIHDRLPGRPVVLDAKRGDIGPTAIQYAVEAFERYGADAVTVSPYVGYDAIDPFVERGSVFVLCRTSNPGSAALQSLVVEGEPLYQRVARDATARWGPTGRLGLVIGANHPGELSDVRMAVGPDVPFLVPAIGAQGGDVDALGAVVTEAGGVVVNSARAVLYASSGEDFAQAARAVAIATRDALDGVWRSVRS